MLKTYLRIARRNLLQNKTLSFINIFGLALGMTFAMLIGLWIHYESSYDNFNKNKDRIALVGKHMLVNNQKGTSFSVMLPLYDELKNNHPELQSVTRLDLGKTHSLVAGNNKFSKMGLYADQDFLNMFSYLLIRGNRETALKDPNSIILTESLAKALFGTEDPMGKIIRIDNQYNVQVSAIAQDIPKNASISFDFLAPFEFEMQKVEEVKSSATRWNNSFLNMAVQIKAGASMGDVSERISAIPASKKTGIKTISFFLYPMSRWHLHGNFENWTETGGQIEYIHLFGLIGMVVLLIACVNFMNLSTARSERRAKEVGIRKAVGSRRPQLIVQFLTESLFTAFLAFLLSLILIQLCLPALKDLGFENIRFDFANIPLLASVLAVCIVTGLAAGSYPALYLSSFLPVGVLKGPGRQGKDAAGFRKILVVSQFVISISLIISTFIVFAQTNYARNRSLGYNPNNLITLEANQDLVKNYDALKQDLLSTGYIAAVTRASSPMNWVNNDFGHFSWTGKDPNADIFIKTVMTDWDYEKAAGIEFIAGRPFSREFKTDSHAVILNEAARDLIAYKDPVGKTMKLGDQNLTIVGIIRNVVMEDPFKPVPPGMILFSADNFSTVMIRLKTGTDLKKTLAAIGPIVERYNPALPFEYHFSDQEFEKKFTIENQVGKLAGIFAGLAIFISSLGLFGLAMFMAERRSKEISIRKVLGASMVNLWILLSRDFIRLVLIASLIATPATWWLMQNWLNKYQYRMDIHWSIFVFAGSLAVIIALLTVSAQAIRAAVANPAKQLRSE
jgi:putative ABC transport system permease protein